MKWRGQEVEKGEPGGLPMSAAPELWPLVGERGRLPCPGTHEGRVAERGATPPDWRSERQAVNPSVAPDAYGTPFLGTSTFVQVVPDTPIIAGRYQLDVLIGRGGMGQVYEGRDLRLERKVAIKILRADLDDPGLRRRFREEARAAGSLSHPNVVCMYDTGEHDGRPFIVMELVPGRTLADDLRAGPLEGERVRRLGLDVLAALGAAHERGIVHRDVKPGNILLASDGSAKVADFGIAKLAEGLDTTVTGHVVGTPAYLAPERLAGRPATPQSDLYSLGVVLYEACTGERPFQGDAPVALAHAVMSGRAPPLRERCPGIDPALARTIEGALEREPERRFRSAREMSRALMGETVPLLVPLPPLDDETVPIDPSTRVLTTPFEVASLPPATDPRARLAEAPARFPGRALLVGIAAAVGAFVLVVAARAGDGPGTGAREAGAPGAGAVEQPSTAPPVSTSSLPAPLDEAIRRLEEAVRP